MSEDRSSHELGVPQRGKRAAALKLSGKLQNLGDKELSILSLYQKNLLVDTQTILRAQGEGHCGVGVSRIACNLLLLIKEVTDGESKISSERLEFASLLSEMLHTAGYYGLTVDGNQIAPVFERIPNR